DPLRQPCFSIFIDEKKSQPASVLSLPTVGATAPARGIAPARCNHVWRGNRTLLWCSSSWALLVRPFSACGRNFTQFVGAPRVRRIFSVAYHHRLWIKSGFHA